MKKCRLSGCLCLISGCVFLAVGIQQYMPYYEHRIAAGDLWEQVISKNEEMSEKQMEESCRVTTKTDIGGGSESFEESYGREALLNVDFSLLEQINKDITAWIDIPGTHISYPVLQGRFLEEYLNRSYDRSLDALGSVFTFPESELGTELHSILFGHRTFDQQMFGDLERLADREYGEGRWVYLYTKDGFRIYEVMASYLCPYSDVSLQKTTDKDRYFQEIYRNARNGGWAGAKAMDEIGAILTLVTCPPQNSDEYRRVVQCICRR